jgi:hypothetical protein
MEGWEMGAITEMAPLPFGVSPSDEELGALAQQVWGDDAFDDPRIVFNHKWQTQIGMPMSEPGELDLWTRTDGRMVLTIQRGYIINPFTQKAVKMRIPFGIWPRREQAIINALVLRRKGLREIPVGEDFTPFLRKQLGKSYQMTGGATGNILAAKEQFMRMLASHYRYYVAREKSGVLYNPSRMIEACDFYYGDDGEQAPRIIRVSQEYAESLYEKSHRAVPVDLDGLLKIRSPLAHDAYSWLTLRVFSLRKKSVPVDIPDKALWRQFGWNYPEMRWFRRDFRKAIEFIQKEVYRDLRIELTDKGWRLWPGKLAIQEKLFPGFDASLFGDEQPDVTTLNVKNRTVVETKRGRILKVRKVSPVKISK